MLRELGADLVCSGMCGSPAHLDSEGSASLRRPRVVSGGGRRSSALLERAFGSTTVARPVGVGPLVDRSCGFPARHESGKVCFPRHLRMVSGSGRRFCALLERGLRVSRRRVVGSASIEPGASVWDVWVMYRTRVGRPGLPPQGGGSSGGTSPVERRSASGGFGRREQGGGRLEGFGDEPWSAQLRFVGQRFGPRRPVAIAARWWSPGWQPAGWLFSSRWSSGQRYGAGWTVGGSGCGQAW